MIEFECTPIDDDPTYKFTITALENGVKYELGRFRTCEGADLALSMFTIAIANGATAFQLAQTWRNAKDIIKQHCQSLYN